MTDLKHHSPPAFTILSQCKTVSGHDGISDGAARLPLDVLCTRRSTVDERRTTMSAEAARVLGDTKAILGFMGILIIGVGLLITNLHSLHQ